MHGVIVMCMTDEEKTLDNVLKKSKTGEYKLYDLCMIDYSATNQVCYREFTFKVSKQDNSLASVKSKLKAEEKELDERISRLSAFMDSKDFADLPFREMQLMNIQRDSMNAYRTTLNARIEEIERRIN